MIYPNAWRLIQPRPKLSATSSSGRRVAVTRPRKPRVTRGMVDGYKFEVRS